MAKMCWGYMLFENIHWKQSQLETSKSIGNDKTIGNKTKSIRNKITTLETSNGDSKQKV